jgi:hypothetical protein
VLGVLWVVAAGVVMLLPALIHGASLGPYGQLPRDGVFEHLRTAGYGQYLQSQDLLLLSFPWHALDWTQVHSGHLPLWNPYNVLGMPLAFNWESAPFSLQTLVSYLGPLRLVLTIPIICNLVIGGTGVYVFCRVLRLGILGAAMAGTVFELSGPFVSLLGWQDPAVMCWAGWLFAVTMLILRGRHRLRYAAAFALIVALAGYGGQPETLFLLGLALVLVVATMFVVRALRKESVRSFMRPIRDLVIAAIAGLAIFSPLALPALQLSRTSVRTKWEPIDNVATAHTLTHGKVVGQALSFHDLTHLIFQTFDGLPSLGGTWFADRGNFFDSAAYLGVIAIVLAIVAVVVRRRDDVVIGIAVMTVCMFGLAFVPLVVSFADQLPVVGSFLWNRALLPMSFGVAVLAGMGTDLVERWHSDRKLSQWLLYGFAAAAAVLVALWLFGRGQLPAAEATVRAHSFIWPAVATAVGLFVALLLWSVRARRMMEATGAPTKRVGQIAAAVLLAVQSAFLVSVGATLWTSGAQFLPTTPELVALQRAVGSTTVGFGSNANCIFPPALGIRANLNAAYALSEFTVYDPMTPLRYFSSWQAMSGQTLGNYRSANIFCPAVTTATLARLYGVSYVLESRGARGPTGAVFDGYIGNEALYRIPGAAAATLSALGQGGRLPGVGAPGSPVSVSHPDPASWSLHTDSATPRVLRLRLTDVTGWHASIDGKPLQLRPYSGIMLQAVVPAGRHAIDLHYWPSAFSVGIVLAVCSVLGFVAALVYVVVTGRERRRDDASPSPDGPDPPLVRTG